MTVVVKKLCQSCHKWPAVKNITASDGKRRGYCEGCYTSRKAAINNIKKGVTK